LYSIIIDQTALIASVAANEQFIAIIFVVLTLLIILSLLLLSLSSKNNRKLIEAQNEEAYLKRLMEYIIANSTQAVAVHDENLNYVYVSEAYFTQYQVKDRNIIGKHHYEVFPDIPEKFREVHQRCLKGETLSNDRDFFIREDGHVEHVRWLCTPWYKKDNSIGGIILYTEVINKLIETEVELKKTNDMLEVIMSNLPIGIALNSVDPNVSFSYVNDNFLKFYGITKEDIEMNKDFWELVYEDEVFREQLKTQVLSDIASQDPDKMVWLEVPIKRKNQPTRYINAFATALPNSNQLISTVIDVTTQKEKEEVIAHLTHYDLLTDLPNHYFYLKRMHSFDNEDCYPLCIVLFDINGLKIINDAYGQEVGNEAILMVANMLKKIKREHDFLARIGGDEFAMICPNTNDDEIQELINLASNESDHLRINNIDMSLGVGYRIKESKHIKLHTVLSEAENHMLKNKLLNSRTVRNDAIQSIFLTLQNKYEEERIHSQRVSHYCKLIGEAMNLSKDNVKELEMAGLYHDIGKISILDSILDKPGPLTNKEWEIMKTHTTSGYQILRAADRYSNLAEYALSHHERFDGKGYPNGLKGYDIPLFARIISVADSYEAMTSSRPYRNAQSHEQAIEELQKHASTQFDSEIVDIFINKVSNK